MKGRDVVWFYKRQLTSCVEERGNTSQFKVGTLVSWVIICEWEYVCVTYVCFTYNDIMMPNITQ